MNSHTVACGREFGILAAGVVLIASVGGRGVGDDVGPLSAVDAGGDEQPININSVAPATTAPHRFKSMMGAGGRISTVRSGRVLRTLSLKI